MGFRFQKRIKLSDNLFLNLSKKGASVTAKKKNVSINSKGKLSVNIPGTGITLFKNLFKRGKRK